MQFTISILSVLFMASALVGATPQGIDKRSPISYGSSLFTKRDPAMSETHDHSNDFAEEAFKKCKEHGIDPDGAMPTDYTSDDGESISFKEGSKFALWIAAQNSHHSEGLTKRKGGSGINVITWTNPHKCTGDGHWYYDIGLGKRYWDPKAKHNNYSLQITKGTVDPNVQTIQIRKWHGGNNKDCDDLFFDVSGKPGCAKDLLPYNCIVLLNVPKA